MKGKKQKSNHISEKNLSFLKENYDFGNGVEITTATTDHKGNRTYDYHYTNKLPDLEINTSNVKRIIKVEASSIEEDDKKLLYYLYNKTI